MSEERRVRALIEEAQALRYSRRQILRRAALFGLSASGLAAVLAACGGSSSTATTASNAATSASSGTSATKSASTSPSTSAGSTTASPAKSGSPASSSASPSAKVGTGKSGFTTQSNMTAPAVVKGQKLNMLMNTYFVAAAQDLFAKQAKDWGAANGVDVTVDYVAWPDVQAKIGAAVQSGSGPDIGMLQDTWPYLYYQNLVDITDLGNDIGDAYGGYFDWVVKTAQVNGKWYSIPIGASGSAYAYRISYFKQAGADTFPDTWEDLFAVGKKLKAMGKPIGQALGHSTGDPISFCYPYMWAYGAMEVKEDGKTVAFNTPQFVDGMKTFIQGWKDGFDDTGLSWDDAANNRAFLADQISATLNGNSIYISALKDNPDLAKDMNHAQYPKGPAGRFAQLGSNSFAIFKYSKSQDAAKEFLKWWFSDQPFGDWLHIQQAYQLAPTKKWSQDPVYTQDPKNQPYGNLVTYARSKGYAGPSDQNAALVFSKYIIVDTFARAVQSGNAQDAINWGADQLKSIYSK